MIKLVYCISKKPGLTDDEFFQYWEKVHGPIGVRIPHLRRLVQSHRVNVAGDNVQPDYDGMAELWFGSQVYACHVSRYIRLPLIGYNLLFSSEP